MKIISYGISLLRKMLVVVGIVKEPATHEYKEKLVKEYAKKYNCDLFIETGTYLGDMLSASYEYFISLSSVEVMKDLYEKAKEKFANMNKIHLYNGDSGKLLPQMIADISDYNKGVLFFLDGHYSGGVTGKAELDTPIMAELDSIRNSVLHSYIILIDDARCFTNKGEFKDYPSIKALKQKVFDLWPKAEFFIRNDVIRIIIKDI